MRRTTVAESGEVQNSAIAKVAVRVRRFPTSKQAAVLLARYGVPELEARNTRTVKWGYGRRLCGSTAFNPLM